MTNKRILILDDEPEILELLQYILGKQYDVRTHNNMEAFDEVIAEFKPDLMVIDHFIGDDTSNDLIRKSIRNSGVPVVLHSAHEDIEKIFAESMSAAYIKKPSSIADIRKTIASVLEANSSI